MSDRHGPGPNLDTTAAVLLHWADGLMIHAFGDAFCASNTACASDEGR